jgi:cobalt-zinc-cadmium efflux system protein
MSRGNLNLRAAYLHNLGDALTSVGVIFAGAMVLLFDVIWVDAALTLVIAAWILWQSLSMMGRSIHILMEGAPADVDQEALLAAMEAVEGVTEIHHLHVWELDEEHRALEAHVVVAETHLEDWTTIKRELKQRLGEQFRIYHTTLEFESHDEADCAPCRHEGQWC